MVHITYKLQTTDFIIPNLDACESHEIIYLNDYYLNRCIQLMINLNNTQLSTLVPFLQMLVTIITSLDTLHLKAFINSYKIQQLLPQLLVSLISQLNNTSSSTLLNINNKVSFLGVSIPIPKNFIPSNIVVIYSDFILHNITPTLNYNLDKCIQLLLPLTPLQLIAIYPLLLVIVNIIITLNFNLLVLFSSTQYQSILSVTSTLLSQVLSTTSVTNFISLISLININSFNIPQR